MRLALRSMYLVSQYIPLTEAEAQAIAYHDGMYVPEGSAVAHKEEPRFLKAKLFIVEFDMHIKGFCNLKEVRA